MTTTRPELGFERLLAALGRDMLDASDEEILAVANELGQKPGMKGSIALLGVTFAWRLKDQPKGSARPTKEASSGAGATGRSRRRPKGDAPSSD
jgi:hypothetical protein